MRPGRKNTYVSFLPRIRFVNSVQKLIRLFHRLMNSLILQAQRGNIADIEVG